MTEAPRSRVFQFFSRYVALSERRTLPLLGILLLLAGFAAFSAAKLELHTDMGWLPESIRLQWPCAASRAAKRAPPTWCC